MVKIQIAWDDCERRDRGEALGLSRLGPVVLVKDRAQPVERSCEASATSAHATCHAFPSCAHALWQLGGPAGYHSGPVVPCLRTERLSSPSGLSAPGLSAVCPWSLHLLVVASSVCLRLVFSRTAVTRAQITIVHHNLSSHHHRRTHAICKKALKLRSTKTVYIIPDFTP